MEGQKFSPEYWQEFRTHYRAVIGAAMCFAFGVGLNTYAAALFAPKLIAEFGWSKSQFALLGSFAILMIVVLPVVGRLADRFGVRPLMTVGALATSIAFVALASMTGDIRLFFAISIFQMVAGVLTTTLVSARSIAERFDRARGMALACMACAPPLVGAILAKPLGALIEAEGWRAGYWALAAISLIFVLLAVVITPPSLPNALASPERRTVDKKADFAQIVKSPSFWLIIGGMFLINLPQTMLGPQLQLVLTGSGATSDHAVSMVSLFAFSVFVGRLICGVSLDRLMPHKVAALTLALPALGMALLALPNDMPLLISAAVMIMGFAQGSEGDVSPYLIAQKFDVRVFSLVMAFVTIAVVVGTSAGAVFLSASFKAWNSYTPFLLICATLTVVGALLFLMLGRQRGAEAEAIAGSASVPKA